MIEHELSLPFAWIALVPALLVVLVLGVGSGLATMLLYRKFSSQHKIAAVVEQSAVARRDLSSYDGADPRELMRRVLRTLRLSLAHVWLVSLPAVAASLPALLLCLWLERRYSQLELISLGPTWMRGWLFTFMVAAAGAALAIKFKLGIR